MIDYSNIINNDLTATVGVSDVPFKFEYNSSTGEYGYRDGADTFCPFKKGGSGGSEPVLLHNGIRVGNGNSTYTTTKAYTYLIGVVAGGQGNPSGSLTCNNSDVEATKKTLISQRVTSSQWINDSYFQYSYIYYNVPSGVTFTLYGSAWIDTRLIFGIE